MESAGKGIVAKKEARRGLSHHADFSAVLFRSSRMRRLLQARQLRCPVAFEIDVFSSVNS